MAGKPWILIAQAVSPALVAVLVAGSAVQVARAADKPPPIASNTPQIMKILRAEEIPQADRQMFEDYFNTWFLKQFEGTTSETFDRYTTARKRLKICLNTGKKGEAHDELVKMTLAKMQKIVASKTESAPAQFHAMLIIGELNKVDEPSKPKPLAEAFPLLMAAIQKPAFADHIKTAALIGLDRFAAAGAIPDARKDEVTQAMLALLAAKSPPANRTLEGHNFMRLRAAHVLAQLGSPGTGNAVVKAFQEVVADPKEQLLLRCEVAQFLGQLKYPPAAKVDLQALANLVGHQAVDICTQELAAAKLADRAPSRRLILYSIYSAKEGIGGLQASADGTPAKQFVSELFAALKSAHADLDSADLVDEEVAEETSTKLADLEKVLIAKAPDSKPDNKPDSKDKKEVVTADRNEGQAQPGKQ